MTTRLRTTALLGVTFWGLLAPAASHAGADRTGGPVPEAPGGLAAASIAGGAEPATDRASREVGAERRALLRPGGLALPVAETLAVQLVMMEWNRRVGAAPWAEVSADSIGRNLRSPWVLDDDDFWINQLAHPYQGTWAFTAARTSGLGFWGSVPFAVGASALWEVAGETTAPSWNDQVTTTVAGVALGEILHRFAAALRADGGAWNEVLASVIEPMGALNRPLVGGAPTHAAPPSRWRLVLGGAAFPAGGSSDPSAPMPYGGLSFTYGVPGSEGLETVRPFDHFVLDAAWTAAKDPWAEVRARGLVVGAPFDAAGTRGVFGAFLSFDFDSPPGYRISTSAVGFGGSGRAVLGGAFALEGDAIASAILLGAAGAVERRDGGGRNYRFGPGEQAVLGVRLLAGARASAGLSLRQYLLLADGGPGPELLVEGTASAALRVLGRHGVGVELSRYLRRADAGAEPVVRSDTAVRIFLAVAGGA